MTWTDRIAIIAGALTDDPRQSARQARDMGFAGIMFDSITGDLDLTTLSTTGVREFRHMLAGHQLQLVGLRSSAGPDGLGAKADLDRLLARLDAVMRTASDLGAPLVCLDAGALPPAPHQPKPRPAITPEQAGAIFIPAPARPEPSPTPAPAPSDPVEASAVGNALSAICALADRYSCTVAIRSELSDFAALIHAIDAARCPWMGVDLDPASMVIDPWSVGEIFDRLGPLVRHVRARDARRGTGNRSTSTVIGQGMVDWNELLDNLSASDYQGFLSIDPMALPHRTAAAQAGRAFLSNIQ